MTQKTHDSTSNRSGACLVEQGRRAERLATAAIMAAMIGIILLQTFPVAPGATAAQADRFVPAAVVLMRGV